MNLRQAASAGAKKFDVNRGKNAHFLSELIGYLRFLHFNVNITEVLFCPPLNPFSILIQPPEIFCIIILVHLFVLFFRLNVGLSFFIKVIDYESEGGIKDGFLWPTGCNGTNNLEIYVRGNDKHILLIARLDNLGKGASGAAVQCMNIMLGIDEATGLEE